MGQLLWNHFNTHFETLSQAANFSIEGVQIPAALFYHTKLYVLTDQYLISKLQNRCLVNFYKTLISLDFDTLQIGSVLNLIEYAYTKNGV